MDDAVRAAAAIDRDTRTRLIATLTRRFGSLDRAEDCLQDAIAQALITWPETGVPASPEAWLTTTAKRRALDEVRRENVLAGKLARLHVEADRDLPPTGYSDPAEIAEPAVVADDRLGMFFACTHPVLREEDRIALTLRFVAGMTTAETAHALLLPVTTAQQRIVRAKKRIGVLGVPFTPPGPDDLADRLPGVLRVVYLMYAEGFARSTGDAHIRDDITQEAIRLARLLHTLLPRAETAGLLALLLLAESRRPARLIDGRPVPLAEQDRSRWDQDLVAEGCALAEQAAARPDAGPYTIQASIAAVHAEARTAPDTDWQQIAVLYRLLEAADPGPVVRVGRAVAIGRAFGLTTGMEHLDRLTDEPALQRYRPFHIARALTLAELGDEPAAADAYRRALELPGNDVEDDYLATALAGLTSPPARPGVDGSR